MAARVKIAALPALVALLPVIVQAGEQVALANACADNCRSAHNQCRIKTKNSPSCDAQLQACLQGCLRK